jgi:C4-dicarboxylate transporter DctM subunit
MTDSTIGILGLIAMIVLMFLRVPLAFSFALTGFAGLIFVKDLQTALSVFSFMPYTWASGYMLACLPMFMLLGLIISQGGIGQRLYSSAYRLVGRLPGALAFASLIAIALFSAVSGSALASVATIAPIAYPEMRKFGYDQGLAAGAVAVGATMDIMIPPSTAMIFYCMLTDASIGHLFMAGFIPGALEVLFFYIAIYIMVKVNPSLAPRSTEVFTFKTKMKSLKGVMPILIIFVVIFGGMYGGIFTPTEAGAVGTIIAFVVVLAMRTMQKPMQTMMTALKETVRLAGTIVIIIIGVMIFNTFLAMSGVSAAISKWVISVGVTPTLFLVVVFALYIPLGAIMDELSMIVLTVPFYLPAVQALNIDLIWFGIIIILAWQLGMVLPPVGLIAFVTQNIVKEPTIETVYKGCLPFAAALVLIAFLIILFPQIALFLPSTMLGR